MGAFSQSFRVANKNSVTIRRFWKTLQISNKIESLKLKIRTIKFWEFVPKKKES